MDPADTVRDHDAQYAEERRLDSGEARLEAERTRRLLGRLLPAPPCTVIDDDGGAGAHAFWPAERGHAVQLIDLSPRRVAEAARRNAGAAHPIASAACGDARRQPFDDAVADAVLLLGPLDHLPVREQRIAALREAQRVLRPGGPVHVAAISRCTAALDGLRRRLSRDAAFLGARDRALADGVHRNDNGDPGQFTTAYFHRPEELQRELHDAGFADVRVLGIEGPVWLMPDFDARRDDPHERDAMPELAERAGGRAVGAGRQRAPDGRGAPVIARASVRSDSGDGDAAGRRPCGIRAVR